MLKCIMMLEKTINGVKYYGCEALTDKAFMDVQRKHKGCCARNCRFFKTAKEQLRTDKGTFYMSDKQQRLQETYSK